MDHRVLGVYPRGRPRRTWKVIVEADIRNLKIKKEYVLLAVGD